MGRDDFRKRLIRLLIAAGNLQRLLLGCLLTVIGPAGAYRLMGFGARCIYTLLDPLRHRCEDQCRAALTTTPGGADAASVARQSFVQRVHNLTDLLLAPRLLHPSTVAHYGGALPRELLERLRSAQRRKQPVILVTAYYGPYDLLPVFLGYNGVRAAVVYRPHANAGFDAIRQRVRTRSGCAMIPDRAAAGEIAEKLENGGVVALVADRHMERRGIPLTFLGQETTASRSVGLLAEHYRADVVVAGIRRTRRPFHFQFVVTDVFKCAAWRDRNDPVAYITTRYMRSLEKLILRDPTQYLWGRART